MLKNRALSLMPSDKIFILKSVEDKVAAKRFVSARHNVIKQSVQMSTFFDVRSELVTSLPDLSSFLSILETDPYSFIIRGELIEGRQKENIRRTGKSSLFNDPNSNFNPAPRQWCMIDIDDLELPIRFADIGTHKSEILAYTVAKLPKAFKGH